MPEPDIDPRPLLSATLDQAQREVDAAGAADLDRPTPCADFTVATLLAHLVAVLRKIAAVGRGEDMDAVPDPAVDRPDSWPAEFRRAHADLDGVWSADALLDASYRLPWGPMTGREVLEAYVPEFAVHAWDLARVTGRERHLDPELAEVALRWYVRVVPAEGRGEGGPFGPVVPVPDDADACTRLAAYVGRTGVLS